MGVNEDYPPKIIISGYEMIKAYSTIRLRIAELSAESALSIGVGVRLYFNDYFGDIPYLYGPN